MRKTTGDPVDALVKRLINASSATGHVNKHLFRCAVFSLAAMLLDELVRDPASPDAPEELRRLNSQLTDFAWAARKALPNRAGAR